MANQYVWTQELDGVSLKCSQLLKEPKLTTYTERVENILTFTRIIFHPVFSCKTETEKGNPDTAKKRFIENRM